MGESEKKRCCQKSNMKKRKLVWSMKYEAEPVITVCCVKLPE